MPRRVRHVILTLAATLALAVALAAPTVAAGSLPSGERAIGQTVIEPAYDAANGSLVYLSTPAHAAVHPVFAKNVAPIYLPVYPVGSTVGTLNCQDTTATTVENCPDHGPLVAGIAAGAVPSVYGAGVLGHDHLVGIASTGGDFNVLWEPVLVLFTDPSLAMTDHVTTLAEINRLAGLHKVIEIALPPATFHCSAVSAAAYAQGTPLGQ